jgi:single-strand DNA-binding protein
MKDVNCIFLIGRLTRDAELKYLNDGKAVTKLSMAVNGFKDGDVSFFDLVLWGKVGEALKQYLVKGKQIGISGELKQQRWEYEGKKQSRVVININDLQLLGGTKKENSSETSKDNIPF